MEVRNLLNTLYELDENARSSVHKSDDGIFSWSIKENIHVILFPPGFMERVPDLGVLRRSETTDDVMTLDTYLFDEYSLLKCIRVFVPVDEMDGRTINAIVMVSATMDPTSGEPNDEDRETFIETLVHPTLQ